MDGSINEILSAWGPYGAILVVLAWFAWNRQSRLDAKHDEAVGDTRSQTEAAIKTASVLQTLAEQQQEQVKAVATLTEDIRRREGR